jgi:hypothetical protein
MNRIHPEPQPGQREAELCCTALLADGWREYPNQFKEYARSFYKRFDTPTRCHGNSDKPGVQILISVGILQEWMSMEMELRAGLKDGTWISIENYSLPKTVEEVVALIPRMLAMWESANEKSLKPSAERLR